MSSSCENTCFPRVLIIVKSQINNIDSTGLSIRSWFGDWPSDCLGQIYSGTAIGKSNLIGSEFLLSGRERRFGWLFARLKDSSLADSAMPYKKNALSTSEVGLKKIFKNVVRKIGLFLVNTGLWEIFFKVKLSTELRYWIEQFKPDVMFVQGCDISFMQLPLCISREYNIPICFDVVDDWVEHLYKGTVFSPVMTNLVRLSFARLARESNLRFAIGYAMSSEYQRRYGVEFRPLMQCDSFDRFDAERGAYASSWKTIRVVYSGSLALGRWRGILELSEAAKMLADKGFEVKIDVYAPFVPDEARPLLTAFSVSMKYSVPDSDVPNILVNADILFLPESFEKSIREYIRLSVSTKAHLYMMSGAVPLVYGPSKIGTVEYARDEGWGYVVDCQGAEYLEVAIMNIAKNEKLRREFVFNGRQVSKKNHLDVVVRHALRESLLSISSVGKKQ